MNPIFIAFGKRVRQARKAKGYSQQRLGDLSGITQVSISAHECGKYLPKQDKLNNLAIALDVTVEWLFADKESINKNTKEIEKYKEKIDQEQIVRHEELTDKINAKLSTLGTHDLQNIHNYVTQLWERNYIDSMTYEYGEA